MTGRHFSAWLGLVPGQHSTGGKTVLLGISKRGNAYLRTLFIHGARAVLRHSANKSDRFSRWAQSVLARRGYNKACVGRSRTSVCFAAPVHPCTMLSPIKWLELHGLLWRKVKPTVRQYSQDGGSTGCLWELPPVVPDSVWTARGFRLAVHGEPIVW